MAAKLDVRFRFAPFARYRIDYELLNGSETWKKKGRRQANIGDALHMHELRTNMFFSGT